MPPPNWKSRDGNSGYPPVDANGASPYFIGKPRVPRRPLDNGDNNGHKKKPRFEGFGLSDGLDMRRTTSVEEIVIEDDNILGPLNPSENRPKSSGRPLDNCQGMSFDFSADPKLGKVKKAIMSIVDPSGRKTSDDRFQSSIATTSSKNMDVVRGKKEKPLKPFERRGLASMDDFRMASGDSVIKEMKQVISDDQRESSQSDSSSSNQRKYLGNKKIGGPSTFSAPPIIKKGMEAMGLSGSSAEVVTGLRAEPSLKHFDENIISLIESEIMSLTKETGWSDVAGLEGAKKALREIVVLPFKRPDVFKGIRAPPKGVLLFGPPGTGKTMIGRCVASQCKATFFNISASSLTSKWVGEGEKLVRALFAVARLKLPSVIFIDEIDSLLSSRSESEHESSRRIKTEFLVQLDGVTTNCDERLLVLGATNRPQELDEAARRRFAKRLYIALPESDARLSIVRNLLADMSHSVSDEDLQKLSTVTDGYSGADMRQLCAEASMGPIRDIDNCSSLNIETVETDDIRPIQLQDFLDAAKVVRPTVVEEDLVSYQAWDKKFGCLL